MPGRYRSIPPTLKERIITIEWHTTRVLRIKVVELTRITVYTYDDQGRETGRQVSARCT